MVTEFPGQIDTSGPALAVGFGEHGLGVTPQIALAYAIVAAFLAGCAQVEKAGIATSAPPEPVAAE